MNILITGATGFIGSAIANHFTEGSQLQDSPTHLVDTIDAVTYAADPDRLNNATHIITCDITQPINTRVVKKQYDVIIHLAAETHVDNSITDPLLFVRTNVIGTANMLEFARTQQHLKKFIYFSTDEVFGPAPEGVNYKEWDRYNSGNPYSATKAGGEELTLAYGNTYKLPIVITHTMNAFGPTQHEEKFIPSTIKKLINGDKVIIHANADKTKAGSRFYIHTKNVAKAIDFIIENGQTQDKYNIVGEKEVDNLELALKIAELLGKPLYYEMVDFHSQRPGHDLRYALDGTKLKDMGWQQTDSFEHDLAETVEWYKQAYGA